VSKRNIKGTWTESPSGGGVTSDDGRCVAADSNATTGWISQDNLNFGTYASALVGSNLTKIKTLINLRVDY